MKHQSALENLVRNTRRELFMKTKYTYTHERVWETEEQEERISFNLEKGIAWDKETEALIRKCYDE